jgi:hypothetical protein
MSTASRDIAEAVKVLSGFEDMNFESIACKVSNIDTTNMTCDCAPINGDANFLDVRLNANYKKGFTLIPKKKSIVIISQLSDATAYVSMVSEVDEIFLAGDANGGLVKVQDLVSKLNTIETDINTLKTVFSSWAPVANDGGAALKTAAATWYAHQLVPTNITDLENTHVQHGNG